MKITDLKINGVKEPIGYDFPYLSLSFKVTETEAKRQKRGTLSVRADGEVVYEKTDGVLRAAGELLPIDLAPMTRYEIALTITGENGDEASASTFFETGKREQPWIAKWIAPAKTDTFHPVFYQEFTAPETVEKARLYITGLGLYTAYLDGERVGDEYMTPYCTDYTDGVQYQTYALTVTGGKHLLEIYVGNGWYKGRIGYEGKRAVFGDRFQALAELHLFDDAGNDTVIATDESWCYRASEILESDNYDGEVFDCLAFEGKENPGKPAALDCPSITPLERYSLPVRVKEDVAAVEVLHTPVGETVVDFGQNFAGFIEIMAPVPRGTRVTFICGELLQGGNFYHDNYRTAKTEFTYVSDGRKDPVRPHFTFSGFRYLKVEGWVGELKRTDLVGKALYSDLDTAIEFSSSDEKLNRLAANCLWGQKGNFLDLPTDCPQRDERLGWCGDAQVFSPTACYNMDTRAFYRKFLLDLMRDEKKHGGAVAGYLPDIGGNPRGASVWSDVATFVPMTMYEHYGDLTALSEVYPLMKDWTEWIIRQDAEHGGRYLWNFGFHFGDWLAQDGITPQSMKGGTDDFFIASIYYYKSVIKTANAAKLLGYETDCKRYCDRAEKIYQAILDEYFAPNGRLCVDTQTAYLLSLRFKVYRDKETIVRGLKNRLKKDCYKIKGGFVGATMMLQTLAENGFENDAYYLLFQEGFPGWFHCINLGATTIWERWNSVLDDGTISGTGMNSLNHYSYGAVMEYVYRYIGGIQPKEAGFSAVTFAPQLNWRLNHVSCAYDSVSGKYVSEWTIHPNGEVTVRFTVPFDCTATAILPGTFGEVVELTAGVFERTYRPKVDFLQKFTADSRLEEVKDDSRAMKILKEELPQAYEMARGDDGESLGLTFSELRTMGYLGFDPNAVDRAAERISALR